MIYSLTGKISRIDENTIVVDTGTIAFEVICSAYTIFDLAQTNEPQTILTYLQVREDGMTLFGFLNRQEKNLFNELIQVSGVGPRLAITILSGLSVDEIVRAVASGDVKLLSSIKGLGKKTTERIVLDLGTKFGSKDVLDGIMSNKENEFTSKAQVMKKEIEEAYEVLVSSGVPKNQAIELAKNNYTDGMTSEELVVACFKNLR